MVGGLQEFDAVINFMPENLQQSSVTMHDSSPLVSGQVGCSTERQGADADSANQFIRRCLWCVERTGSPRYWHNGEWIHLPSPQHFFGLTQFTDGVCEPCSEKLINDLLIKPTRQTAAAI
jgi:hypothetical protein